MITVLQSAIKVVQTVATYHTYRLLHGKCFVRYLRTSCWRIRKLTRSLRSLVRFLIQKQLVRKYRTKHFPCCNLFILYLLRFFNPNQIFTLHQAEQISSYVFIPSECKHVASSNPRVNIFRSVYLASPAFDLFPLLLVTSFASSLQTIPCLVKLVVVEKALRHICLL